MILLQQFCVCLDEAVTCNLGFPRRVHRQILPFPTAPCHLGLVKAGYYCTLKTNQIIWSGTEFIIIIITGDL